MASGDLDVRGPAHRPRHALGRRGDHSNAEVVVQRTQKLKSSLPMKNTSSWIRLFSVTFCLMAVFCPVTIDASDFTIVILPDTQRYTEAFPENFRAQTEWVVHNRVPKNIVFLAHVGDIVQTPTNMTQWKSADQAMAVLDGDPGKNPDGLLPYAVALGNHDYDDPTCIVHDGATRYIKFFGGSRYKGRSWYGGASPDDHNHYQFFQGDGQTYLHIDLEWEAPDSSLQWAQGILDRYPDTPTLITTHYYLRLHLPPSNTTGHQRTAISEKGNPAVEIFQQLVRPNPQVFMVNGGHYSGETHQISTNAAGLPVFEMMADFSHFRPKGGNGWLRLIQFKPDDNVIQVRTYSPVLDRFETDADSQFSFHVNFADRLPKKVLGSEGSVQE